MWNSGSESKPVKTEYDPCPDGWRVPTSRELSKLYGNYYKIFKPRYDNRDSKGN